MVPSDTHEKQMETREEILVGTNEEFIMGYYVTKDNDGKVTLVHSFSNHKHIGSIKQIAVSGKFLVSSGTDEYLRIFDLNRRKEMGDLMQHSGTVTCLRFHTDEYLFSASEDGTIVLYERGTWRVLSKLKGHTAPVSGLSIHPSGKIAVSVGKNKQMITWNLLNGKMACKTSLRKVPELIQWSPDGQQYAIVSDKLTSSNLDLFSLETGRNIHSVEFQSQIHSMVFITNDIVAIGAENKTITLYSLNEKREVGQWEAHKNRVKQLVIYDDENPEAIRMVSVSSDGYIKMWSFSVNECSKDPLLLTEIDTKCRITCLAVRADKRLITAKGSKPRKQAVSQAQETVEVKQEVLSEDEDVEIVKTNTNKRKLAPLSKTGRPKKKVAFASDSSNSKHAAKTVTKKPVAKLVTKATVAKVVTKKTVSKPVAKATVRKVKAPRQRKRNRPETKTEKTSAPTQKATNRKRKNKKRSNVDSEIQK